MYSKFVDAISNCTNHRSCVVVKITSKDEYDQLEVFVKANTRKSLRTYRYGERADSDCFYIYPLEGYYGHYSYSDLITEVDPENFNMINLETIKIKLLNAIKDFR